MGTKKLNVLTIDYKDVVQSGMDYIRDLILDDEDITCAESIQTIIKSFHDKGALKGALKQGNSMILLAPIFGEIERMDAEKIPYVVAVYRDDDVYLTLTPEDINY